MSKDETDTKDDAEKQEDNPSFFKAWRRVMLATVGAIVLAQDEIETLVEHLVTRGEIAEKEARSLVKELQQKRKTRFEKLEGEVNKRLADRLERMNIPSRSDIDSLREKIAQLSKRLDELDKVTK